jgi:hypothetical protein
MNPILTESKTGWQRDQTRYRDFLVAFQKYLFSFGESATIDLVGIAFPPIAFGEDIAFPEKVYFYNCTFYGDLLVKNVRHRQPLRVQECRFMGEVRIDNSVFASMDQLENTFESEVHWSDLTFEGEVYCSYHVCKEKVYMTDVMFRDQADFDSIFLVLFFQKLIAEGNDEVKSILGVAYVENLMWDFDDKQRTEAWKHIPDQIKDRYEKIWRSYTRKG